MDVKIENSWKNALHGEFEKPYFISLVQRLHKEKAEGIQIFHNPFAEIPLDPRLFPRAGHNFYKDGIMRSVMPDNQLISTMTYNLKNFPSMPPEYKFHSNTAFNDFEMKWRMGAM